MSSYKLVNSNGQRKYLTVEERKKFIANTENTLPTARTYCRMVAYTGCLLSEALNMKYSDIDFKRKTITIYSLKKRNGLPQRSVPIPDSLLNELQIVHQKIGNESEDTNDYKLWSWGRKTGYKKIKAVMEQSNVLGICANSYGLRHSYGIHCVTLGIPLNYIKKWMGHSSLDITCLYLVAVEQNERELAQRMWY